MSIIKELERKCLDSKSDIVNILNTSLLIAYKLNLKEFQDFLLCELNGYPINKEVPCYRSNVKCELKYLFFNNMTLQPFSYDRNFNRAKMSVIDLRISIPEIVFMLRKENDIEKSYNIPIDDEKTNLIWEKGDFCKYPTYLCIDYHVLEGIVANVHNRVLMWLLTLDSAGIQGDDVDFSVDEQNKAMNNETVFNCIIVNGNVDNTMLQQGANSSSQK